MSRTHHHNPELSTKYLRETSNALVTQLRALAVEHAFDFGDLMSQIESSTSLYEACEGSEHESPFTAEELAWFRHCVESSQDGCEYGACHGGAL
jgi:hypothetical protein